MIKSVTKLLSEEIPFEIPWSTTLQTIDGERICVIDVEQHTDSGYPYLCLTDYGTEVGCDLYTIDGEWDVGVASGSSLMPIPK